VIALVVIAVFVMAIVSFLMAIWDFIRSEWEEEEKKKGWNRIRFMMIGVILTIVFLVLFPLLLRQLGVIHYELFDAPSIFTRVWAILNYVLSMWSYMQEFYQGWAILPFGAPASSSSVGSSYTL
jgi:amino acid transporter